jgi:hypothetical protein
MSSCSKALDKSFVEGDLPRTNCIERLGKRGFELEIPLIFPRKKYTGNLERKNSR